MMRISDQNAVATSGDTGLIAEQMSGLQPRALDVLLHRKFLICTAAIIGALLFAAYAYFATPVYTSEALVVTSQPEFGQETTPFAASREVQAAALLSDIDLIRSSAFVSRVVNEFDLTRDPEFDPSSSWFQVTTGKAVDVPPEVNPSVKSGTNFWFMAHLVAFATDAKDWIFSRFSDIFAPEHDSAAPKSSKARMSEVVRSVNRHLTVANDSHSVTIQISFWSYDPSKATKIANAFAENFVKDKLETKQQQSEKINTWLDGRLAELRTRVIAANRAVEEERQRLNINLSDAGTGSTLSDQVLLQWNVRYVEAQSKRLTAEARLNTARKMLADGWAADSTSDALASLLIQRLREQKALLTSQYAATVFRGGAKYPGSIALKRQIDDISDSIRAETQKVVNSLANEVATAKHDEAVVRQTLDAAKSQANISQLDLTKVRELEQRAASERGLYDQFLRKFNETLGHNYLPQSDARTISPASWPDRPSYPKMIVFAPAGFLMGMFFGIVKALHAAGSNRTFRASRAVETATGLPTLALVPAQPRSRRIGAAALTAQRHFEQSVARVMAILGQTGRLGQLTQVVAVTSSLPQEGKSTLCAALARSASWAGRRVIIIDFDRHFPGLPGILGVSDGDGDVMDLVAEARLLSEIVQKDTRSDADFLPVLGRRRAPHVSIRPGDMCQIFSKLRETYDLIIVDTAPVLANADIAIMADVIDACLFVVRWGNTPREAVGAALSQLRLLNVDASGIVLTGVDTANAQSEAEGKFYDQIRRYYSYRDAA